MPLKVMQTKENLSRIALELGEDLEKDDIIYAEVRFAPQLHTKNGLSYDDIVFSVIEGFKKCNIKINVILCMMRGASYINNLKTIEVAEKYLNKGVVALDLAGDEKHFKTKDYEDLFKMAKEKNIPFTIHAGEADNANSVLDAISFGAKRIGHGIRIIDDNAAIDEVIKNNIEYISDTTVIDLTHDKEVVAINKKGMLKYKAKAVVLARYFRSLPNKQFSN